MQGSICTHSTMVITTKTNNYNNHDTTIHTTKSLLCMIYQHQHQNKNMVSQIEAMNHVQEASRQEHELNSQREDDNASQT